MRPQSVLDTTRKAQPDATYPHWVVHAREDAATRAALRAGGIDSMAYRAYPYLAQYWAEVDYLREPLLLHAAAAAAHPNVRQTDNGGGIGRLADRLVQNGMSKVTAGSRLMSVQQMPLRNAHRVFFSLLHMADGQHLPLHWVRLYVTYRLWDHPVRATRLGARRRVLEEFYGQPPFATNATPTESSLETS